MSKLVDLASHGKYKPDVVGLACGKVTATRTRLGLSRPEFAAELGRLLTWEPSPDIISSWERRAAPPPGDVLAACDVLAPQGVGLTQVPADSDAGDLDSFRISQLVVDVVASAANDADTEQLTLLSELAPEAIASLWQEMTAVARSNRTPWAAFSACRRVRSRALKLVDQTRRPATLSDLYLLAGTASALMASTAFDLHCWDASDRLAQSAVSFATLIGNDSLKAWAIGLSALLSNWRNEPEAALTHFRDGLEIAPSGTPRVRLRYIAARSYALLGDFQSVRTVLDEARYDRDDATKCRDLMSEEIGGEFAFAPARAEACAAAAWLDLGRGEEAREFAQRAIAELAKIVPGCRPISQTLGSKIDLATAHIMSGDLDEAYEIVTGTIAAATNLKNASLAGRLARTRSVLISANHLDSSLARQLDEGIRELISAEFSDLGFPVLAPG